MRQKDYIADSKGYRILKSKTVFVGNDLSIQVKVFTDIVQLSYSYSFRFTYTHLLQDAIKAAKKIPATAGTQSDLAGIAQRNYIPSRRGGSFDFKFASTVRSTTVNPNQLEFNHSDLVSKPVKPLAVYLPQNQRTPIPFSPPHENPSVYVTPRPHLRPASSLTPSLDLEAPFASQIPAGQSYLHEPIAVYSPEHVTPISNHETSTASPFVVSSIRPHAVEHLQNNHVESATFASTVQPTTYRPKLADNLLHYDHRNGFEKPLFDRNALRRQTFDHQQQPLVSNNALGNGYDPQYPYYDGVSETADGFRYYLPRQYHEEYTNSERRAGSFGYVDPFGIRRVVYYNTSPDGGFVHRKNNRYVGFNGTPYDPRPL